MEANRSVFGVLCARRDMIIGSRQRLNQLCSDPVLYIGDTKLKRVNNTASLSVIIDENLNWKRSTSAEFAKRFPVAKEPRDVCAISFPLSL